MSDFTRTSYCTFRIGNPSQIKSCFGSRLAPCWSLERILCAVGPNPSSGKMSFITWTQWTGFPSALLFFMQFEHSLSLLLSSPASTLFRWWSSSLALSHSTLFRLPPLPQTPAPRLHLLLPARKAALKTLWMLKSCSWLKTGGRGALQGQSRATAAQSSALECDLLVYSLQTCCICIFNQLFIEFCFLYNTYGTCTNAQYRSSCKKR